MVDVTILKTVYSSFKARFFNSMNYICLRWLAKIIFPKLWFFMVIYHGTIRKTCKTSPTKHIQVRQNPGTNAIFEATTAGFRGKVDHPKHISKITIPETT